MKTVLHYSPSVSVGGTDRMAADTAVAMQIGGLAHNVMLVPGGAATAIPAAYGIPIRRACRVTPLSFVAEARRLRHAIRSVKPQAVLLYGLNAARVAWWACQRLKKEERPKFVAILTGHVRGMLTQAALRTADAVVVFSRCHRNALDTRRLRPLLQGEKLWVIPYGVDETLCHPHYKPSEAWREDWERRFPDFGATTSLCIPGSITPVRGLELLPELLQALRRQEVNARFYIAGDRQRADSAYLKRLHHLFEKSGTAPHISWVNPQDGMRELLSLCDITLSLSALPATYDRCILEALSLGRPVVGFEHGHVGELLNHFLPEGNVPTGNLEVMADIIAQWSIYPPDLPDTVPYPYRITDTANSLSKICDRLLGKKG